MFWSLRLHWPPLASTWVAWEALLSAFIWLLSSSGWGCEVFEMEHPHQIEDQGVP